MSADGVRTHPDRDPAPLRAYVGTVVLGGSLLLVAYLARPDPFALLNGNVAEFGLFFVSMLVCEILPIRVFRDGDLDELVASTTFAFATLLAFGPVPAILAQGSASVIADMVHGKRPLKASFNLGQYWVAWGIAAVPLLWLSSPAPLAERTTVTITVLLAVLASGACFFAVNNTLVGVVLGLSGGEPLLQTVVSAFRRESRSHLMLLALGPVFLVVVDRSLLLYPLVLLAVFAVYRGAAVSVEKEHQGSHDALTGLPNRVLFNRRLDGLLDRAGGGEQGVAVLLIDLDRFKEVNDTLGHGAGDALLQQIGSRIAESLEEGCTIARLGGDEFGVLLVGPGGPLQAMARAAAIVEGLEQPFHVAGGGLDVEASIGVALAPDHGTTREELLQRADIAMYVAKTKQHAVELYSVANDHHSRRRLGLLADLRTALNDGQLVVHYQPKINLVNGRIDAVEALVRWDHPVYGLMSPNEFVPLAERSGLIRPLTRYVLSESLVQVARWRDLGLDIAVSVNLSARNLHDPHLATELLDVLARNHLPARHLQLEITESSIMGDPDRAAHVLNALDHMGIRLAIDDFGTGYSSLAYLQKLPVSEIKIDRSFVSGMVHSVADQVIVRSTIDLARNLGLTVTAEGVESQDVLRLLRDGGCHSAQGYFISRPIPADELEALLQRSDPASKVPGPVIDLDRDPVIDLTGVISRRVAMEEDDVIDLDDQPETRTEFLASVARHPAQREQR